MTTTEPENPTGATAGSAPADTDDDMDVTYTLHGTPSQASVEKAGAPGERDEEEREAEAPDPTDAHEASDGYPDVPPLGGITESDRRI